MTSRFFGRVPCQPWGTIPYTETASAERRSDGPARRDAARFGVGGGGNGESLLSFPAAARSRKRLEEIRAELVGEDGSRYSLLPSGSRPRGRRGRARIGSAGEDTGRDVYTLYVPDFTENGVYSLRIDETDIDFTGSEGNMLPGTLSVVAADRELTVSEVRKEDGVTRLYIDGKKVNPMLYLRDVSTKFKTSYAESMFGSGVVLLGFPNTRTDT